MRFRPLHNAVVILPLAESDAILGSILVKPQTSLHAGRFDERGGIVGQYNDEGLVMAAGQGHRYGRKLVPHHTGSTEMVWQPVVHAQLLPLAVKEGDRVLYAHKGGQDYVEDGIAYRIIPESQIEAVIESC